jgi:putative FmdB family regulatory protein
MRVENDACIALVGVARSKLRYEQLHRIRRLRMPTYEYRCPNGHDFERFFRKMSDATGDVTCPVCGAVAVRRLSASGLVFKGSGFYLTDYGKNAHRGGAAPDHGVAAEAARSGESSSEGGSASAEGKGSGSEGASGGESSAAESKSTSETKPSSESSQGAAPTKAASNPGSKSEPKSESKPKAEKKSVPKPGPGKTDH